MVFRIAPVAFLAVIATACKGGDSDGETTEEPPPRSVDLLGERIRTPEVAAAVCAWLFDNDQDGEVDGSMGRITLVGTSDTGSESLFDADLSGPVVFVMGREQSGLRKSVAERCDLLVNLPMRGSVQSLNVSVATGICLYEAVRQRRADKKQKTP